MSLNTLLIEIPDGDDVVGVLSVRICSDGQIGAQFHALDGNVVASAPLARLLRWYADYLDIDALPEAVDG